MSWLQCTLAFIAVSITTVNSWDIAITANKQIQYYNETTKAWTEDATVKDAELKALAYDAVRNMLLYVNTKSDNVSIFGYYLSTAKTYPLVGRKDTEDIESLAFDPVSGKIFWTVNNKKIMWKLKDSRDNVYGQELNVNFEKGERPGAVAVDSCGGYIYWTNLNISNPTITRARLDGSEKEVIIKTNGQPTALAVDQRERKLYWSAKQEGAWFTIESSDLDGKNLDVVFKHIHNRVNALTISMDSIYWVDIGYNVVWKLLKTKKTEPEQLKEVPADANLFGTVANYGIKDLTNECEVLRNLPSKVSIKEELTVPAVPTLGIVCLYGDKVSEGKEQCKCHKGFTGERCEIDMCHNYCLNGECSTPNGKPICSCKPGYSGGRCEVNVCESHCTNGGVCQVKDEKPMCTCRDGFSGARCEAVEKESCDCTAPTALESTKSASVVNDGYVESCNNNDWDSVRDPLIMVLGGLTAILAIVCAYLVRRVVQLKKRPRIKKRIIVQKNSTPLTARPDQCEITIENCCNMNICETVNDLNEMQRDFLNI